MYLGVSFSLFSLNNKYIVPKNMALQLYLSCFVVFFHLCNAMSEKIFNSNF